MHTHTTQEYERNNERTNFGVGNVHAQHTYFRRVFVTFFFFVCSNRNAIHWQLSKWQLVFSRYTSRRQWQLNLCVPFAHTFCIFSFDLKTTIGIFSLWNWLCQPKVQHPHYYEWTRMFHIRCPNKLWCPFQVCHAWQKYAEWFLLFVSFNSHMRIFISVRWKVKLAVRTQRIIKHINYNEKNLCWHEWSISIMIIAFVNVFYSISMIFVFCFWFLLSEEA